VRRTREPLARVAVAALFAGAIALIWVTVLWGRELQRMAPEVFLGAAPLVGRNFRDAWDWRFGWGLVGAGGVACAVVWAVATGWVERVRLRWLLLATGLSTGAFSVLLALTGGQDGLLFGAADDNEYLANLGIAPPAGEFVREFANAIANDAPRYSVHIRGHPPGFLLLLKAMDAVGLTGPWPVVAVSVLATMLLPIGVLVAVWAWSDGSDGERWVRRCAPFLVVAPYALWMVTSADAFYTALGAWGVAAIAVGVRSTRRQAVAAGLVAGTALSMLLFFTYGAAIYLLLPVVLTVAAWRRRMPGSVAVAVSAVVAALVVTGVWWLAGFWWFDGASATRDEYWEGTAKFRIWNYFALSNLAVTLIATGPITLVGVTRLRSRSMWVLVGGALLALSVANLSQLSKGEVERIWLLFFPWIVLAGGAIGGRRLRSFGVVAQATTAIALQAALVSKW
jgi:methylthioxylose transferase